VSDTHDAAVIQYGFWGVAAWGCVVGASMPTIGLAYSMMGGGEHPIHGAGYMRLSWWGHDTAGCT